MENITIRSCDYKKDQNGLTDLWLDQRAVSDVRLYPTIWRIRLLLTSRVWDKEKDTRIWENGSGEIIGFAMLWQRRQTSPYIVLDALVHPMVDPDGLLLAILQWGDRRAQEIAARRENPLTMVACGFSQHHFSTLLLEQYGFAVVPPNPEEHNVYFARSLHGDIPAPMLPAGFSIRPLLDIDDLEQYQALNGFAKVDPQHQKELIASDEYDHLVVVNPVGEFVAYCECSVCHAEWERTHQRIGWIDYIETRPDQKKKGVGRAILLAGLEQLQEWGANIAMLVTVNTNIPAVSLYNRTGFEPVEMEEYPGYQKQYSSPGPGDLVV